MVRCVEMPWKWNLIILFVDINSKLAFSNQLKELTLQGFLPMTGKGWVGGGACLPATLMALRHVNEKPGLLDDYNLTYTWVDTQVNFHIKSI